MTRAQMDAADALMTAGVKANKAEQEWGNALNELQGAVAQARKAGIPDKDIPEFADAMVLRGLGKPTAERLREMIRAKLRCVLPRIRGELQGVPIRIALCYVSM